MGDGFSFKHHQEEAERGRRRFFFAASFLATLLLLLSANVWHTVRTQAANVVVSGRVTVNGAGAPGVRVAVCYNNMTLTTDANGGWSVTMPQDAAFCARVTGGTSVWSGPQTNNNAEVGGARQKVYEYQQAGRPCYKNSTCGAIQQSWDRNSDSGYDFRFANAAPVGESGGADCARTVGYAFDPDNSSASSSVRFLIDGKQAAEIRADLDRSDVRARHGISGNHGYSWMLPDSIRDGAPHTIDTVALNTGTMGPNTNLTRRVVTCAAPSQPARPSAPASPSSPAPPTPPAPGEDKTPPSVPEAFAAAVMDGSAIVSLTWGASADASGVKGYRLERSLDGQTWSVLKELQSETSYRDDSAGYEVRYFYRVTAIDTAGNTSAPATAEITTNPFEGSNAATNLSIISEDKLLEVVIPAGAVEGAADCRLEKGDVRTENVKSRVLLAGPFEVICKTEAGEKVQEFREPVAYNFRIKRQLKGHRAPVGVAYLDNAPQDQESSYDGRQGVLSFTLVSARPVGVLATPVPPIAFGVYVAAAGFILGVVALFMWALRRRQKQTYEEYLRKKYYDL